MVNSDDRSDRRAHAARGALAVLAWRELVRFRRQPARIVAALGTALAFWLVIGSGLAESMRLPAPEAIDPPRYAAYLVPGMMTLVAMFTAVFAAIALIDDRRDGFLQGVLVSPTPRWAIASGTIAGASIVALIQSALLLPLAWIAGSRPGLEAIPTVLVSLALTCIALQSVGFALAWRCRDTASFHAVMNTVLMPMWLLSDAFFPIEGASPWLATIIAINPLSWCGEAIRSPLLGEGLAPLAMAGTAAFAAIALGTSIWLVSRPSRLVMGG